MNHFTTDLDKNKANYVPLSPLSFITRVKEIYPNWKLEANDLKNYISELSKYDNGNEFPSMYASEIFSTSYSEL